jgi:hypothetical protein
MPRKRWLFVWQLVVLRLDKPNIISGKALLVRRKNVFLLIDVTEVILTEEDSAHGVDLAVEHIILPHLLEKIISLQDNRLVCTGTILASAPSVNRISMHTQRVTEALNSGLHIVSDTVLEIPRDSILDLSWVSDIDRGQIQGSQRVANIFRVIARVGIRFYEIG